MKKKDARIIQKISDMDRMKKTLHDNLYRRSTIIYTVGGQFKIAQYMYFLCLGHSDMDYCRNTSWEYLVMFRYNNHKHRQIRLHHQRLHRHCCQCWNL